MKMYKDVWSRMLEFEEAGLGVLGTNHYENLQRVRNEDFAYLADETSAAILMSEDCRVTTAPYKFIQNPYAIGIQKNSVHTNTITKM